jgi:hypothetical protein
MKWLANACFAAATISLLSPHVAATSLFPWVTYLIGNGVWTIDSLRTKNWPWVWMAGFFSVWDILLIVTRLFGVQVFSILDPLVKLLEMLP